MEKLRSRGGRAPQRPPPGSAPADKIFVTFMRKVWTFHAQHNMHNMHKNLIKKELQATVGNSAIHWRKRMLTFMSMFWWFLQNNRRA